MKQLNIVHISDLHASKNNIQLMKDIVSSLTKDINSILAGNHVDLIAFTGDLVHSGSNGAEEAKLAFDTFFMPLLANLKLDATKLFICPGNHDNDLSLFNEWTFNGLHASINNDINKLEAFFNDKSIFNKYNTTTEFWNKEVQSRNSSVSKISPISSFSIMDCNQTIVGICLFNTAWSSCGKSAKDVGNLTWGYPELEQAFNILSECDIKIMLMHHPTYYLAEFEKDYCESMLANFDMVLSGHLHKIDDKHIHSPLGETLYLTAGRLDSKHTDLSGYSLIQVNPYTNNITVHFRKYYFERKVFDKALSIAPEGMYLYELAPTDKYLAFAYKFAITYKKHFIKYAQNDAITTLLGKEKRLGYIEPTLKNYSALDFSKKPINDVKDISVNTIVSEDKSYLVYGRPQYGKSVVLKYIALTHFDNFNIYRRVPLIVDLNHIDLKGKNQLLRALQKSISEITEYNLSIEKEQLESLFYSGYSTVLIDNIDLRNSKHRQIIDDFHATYPKVKLVLTTVENQLVPEYTQEISIFKKLFECTYLHAFDKSSLRTYVSTYLSDDTEDIDMLVDKVSSSIQEIGMAKTPFNAVMLLTVFYDVADFQAVNEATLIERFMEIVLEKINPDEVKSERFDFKNKEDFLSYIAHSMYKNNSYCISTNDYDKFVEQYFMETGLNRKSSGFDNLFFDKNILVSQNNEVFFSYTFLSEYYLAKYFLEEGIPSEVFQNLNYLNFTNELIYYTGLRRKDIELFDTIHKDLSEIIDTHIKRKEYVTDFKLKTNISYDMPLSKPSVEERAVLTDLPERNINDTPNIHKKESSKSQNYSKDDDATLVSLLFLYSKLLRNYEYLEPLKKQEGICLCVKGTNLLIYISNRLLTRFVDEEIPNMKNDLLQEGKNIDEVNKSIQTLVDVFKTSIPLTLQTSMSTWFASKKLLPQFDEIVQSEVLHGMDAFLFHATLVDMSSMHDAMSKYIKSEKNNNLLNLLYFKIRLSFYYTTSPTEEKRLEILLGTLMSKLNPTSVTHKKIKSFDKQKALQQLYKDKKEIQDKEQ